MARTILALVAEIAVVLVLALLLLGSWLRITGQEAVGVTGEAPRLLFLFMDIGLGVWVLLLIIAAVRRHALPGVGITVLAAVIGVVLNALTVLVVGVAQGQGLVVAGFLTYAIEAGLASLLAVLITAPIIHRLVKPRPAAPPSV